MRDRWGHRSLQTKSGCGHVNVSQRNAKSQASEYFSSYSDSSSLHAARRIFVQARPKTITNRRLPRRHSPHEKGRLAFVLAQPIVTYRKFQAPLSSSLLIRWIMTEPSRHSMCLVYVGACCSEPSSALHVRGGAYR